MIFYLNVELSAHSGSYSFALKIYQKQHLLAIFSFCFPDQELILPIIFQTSSTVFQIEQPVLFLKKASLLFHKRKANPQAAQLI